MPSLRHDPSIEATPPPRPAGFVPGTGWSTGTAPAAVGYDTIESDDIGNGSDRLFFDEECFIRGSSGRFRIDKLIPVAGKGVVVGVSADGNSLRDVSVSLDDLRSRTRFG